MSSMPIRTNGVVAALDIGGTKLEAGVIDDTGTVLARRRVKTPRAAAPEGDPRAGEELFSTAEDLVRRALVSAGLNGGGGVAPRAAGGPRPLRGLGVGCGGPMSGPDPADPSAGACTVSPLNIPQWRDFPLGARLRDAFGVPVRVDNDAKALALGEGAHGAAVGVEDYVAMVVSTGVGGGIVLDGRLLDGSSGNAGHIGHLVVDPLGHPCPCGARGCLEAEVSGTAIARITGADPRRAAPEVRRHAGRLVGRAVGSVCNMLDLRLAVLAGSVAIGFGEPFMEAARDEVARVAVLDHSRGATIRIGLLGADGPLVGAACVGRLAVTGRAAGSP